MAQVPLWHITRRSINTSFNTFHSDTGQSHGPEGEERRRGGEEERRRGGEEKIRIMLMNTLNVSISYLHSVSPSQQQQAGEHGVSTVRCADSEL